VFLTVLPLLTCVSGIYRNSIYGSSPCSLAYSHGLEPTYTTTTSIRPRRSVSPTYTYNRAKDCSPATSDNEHPQPRRRYIIFAGTPALGNDRVRRTRARDGLAFYLRVSGSMQRRNLRAADLVEIVGWKRIGISGRWVRLNSTRSGFVVDHRWHFTTLQEPITSSFLTLSSTWVGGLLYPSGSSRV